MLVPSNYQIRCVFALATSVYHLVESSASSRHGEYPWLYISWAWLLPDAWAHAASFGVMVHFVLSSGIAKVIIGGAGWLDARTLKTYLDVYRPSKSSPPLSRRVSQEIAARTWMLQLIGAGTILLECLLIPACLLLPPTYRPLGALAMIGMHFGIGLSMSLEVAPPLRRSMPCLLSRLSLLSLLLRLTDVPVTLMPAPPSPGGPRLHHHAALLHSRLQLRRGRRVSAVGACRRDRGTAECGVHVGRRPSARRVASHALLTLHV